MTSFVILLGYLRGEYKDNIEIRSIRFWWWSHKKLTSDVCLRIRSDVFLERQVNRLSGERRFVNKKYSFLCDLLWIVFFLNKRSIHRYNCLDADYVNYCMIKQKVWRFPLTQVLCSVAIFRSNTIKRVCDVEQRTNYGVFRRALQRQISGTGMKSL